MSETTLTQSEGGGYVGETIALILGFVGIKILIAEVTPINDLASLMIIALLLAGRRPPRRPPELVPMQSADGRSKTQRSRS